MPVFIFEKLISRKITGNIMNGIVQAYEQKAKLEEERQQTKFYFDEIMFEITRKCNLKCAHCMRGDMQPVSMKKEVIDKMLDVSSGIQHIFLTGGEPFLEPDLIEYMVDRVIELDFDVKYMGVITNGTILNDLGVRCVKALNRFAEWSCKKNELEQAVAIAISNDDFHGNDVENALHFYKPYVGNQVALEIQEKTKPEQLQNAGRAKVNKLAVNDKRTLHALKRRIRIDEGNKIPCLLELTPDGKLVTFEFKEWKEQDVNAIGNIMQKSLVDMFERNQWNEYMCNEAARILLYAQARDKEDSDEKTKKTFEYLINGYEHLIQMRIKLHKLFPYLDYAEIAHMSYSVEDLYTEGNWIRFTLKGYEEFKHKLQLEDIEKNIESFIDINNGRRREGYSKVRLVPYNPKNGRINQCDDLDEKGEKEGNMQE